MFEITFSKIICITHILQGCFLLTVVYGGPSLSHVFLASKQRSTSFSIEIINSIRVSFYFIFDSPYNFYFELSFKSHIDFKRFFNFKSNVIITLNFKNAYWERTSAIKSERPSVITPRGKTWDLGPGQPKFNF